MIKRILSNNDLIESLGYLLLIGLTAWIFKMNPDTIDKESTTLISVSISSIPEYEKGDDERAERITFKGKGYKNTFEIKTCAINDYVKEAVLNLNLNDSISVIVEKEDLKRIVKRFVYHPISIHGISHFEKGEILSLNDFNNCRKSFWKKIAILGLLFLGYIIYKIWKILQE